MTAGRSGKQKDMLHYLALSAGPHQGGSVWFFWGNFVILTGLDLLLMLTFWPWQWRFGLRASNWYLSFSVQLQVSPSKSSLSLGGPVSVWLSKVFLKARPCQQKSIAINIMSTGYTNLGYRERKNFIQVNSLQNKDAMKSLLETKIVLRWDKAWGGGG